MRNLVLLNLAATLAVAGQLYEEDIAGSMSIRNRNWQQIQQYAAKLARRPEPSGSTLAQKIGYPAPGLKTGRQRLEQIGRDELATYYRSYIPLSTDLDAYGLYIVPHSPAGRKPLVISQHGGGGSPELALFRDGSNYHDMVRGPLREGYIVYAPLLLMYPYVDRDLSTPIPDSVRADLDKELRGRGTSLFALEVSAIHEALNVLLKRPEIDPKRVAMVGLSYGGFYTLYTMALEPRISSGVASCSFRDYDQAEWDAKPKNGQPYDLSPAELVKLISPRPIQIQCGLQDKGLPVDSARLAYAKVKGSAGLDYQEFEGVHEWNGPLAWKFLEHKLGKH